MAVILPRGTRTTGARSRSGYPSDPPEYPMYAPSRSPSTIRRTGRALILSAVVLASACGDVTAPTVAEEPESPAPPDPLSPLGQVPATLPGGRLLVVRGDRILLVSPHLDEPTVVAEAATLPSWSPDGSMLAYVGSGGTPLCIGSFDGAQPRCTAVEDDVNVYFRPSWSPDGGSLAYSTYSQSDGFSGLRVLDVATMTDRVVTSFPVISPSWSPDGSRIALVYGSDWNFRYDFSGSLGTIAPDGSGFRTISEGDGRYLFRDVTWSPTGESLAFNLSDQWNCPMGCNNHLGVASLGVSGGALSPLRVVHRDVYAYGMAWSPDETGIAFGKQRCSEGGPCTMDVMYVRVGDGGASVLVSDSSWPDWGR